MRWCRSAIRGCLNRSRSRTYELATPRRSALQALTGPVYDSREKERNMLGTGKRLCLVVGLVAVLAWPGFALAASTITGTIVFNGKPPALKPLSTEAEPTCH